MEQIKYDPTSRGTVITVFLETIAINPVDDLRKAIKILTREVVKYEHGIDLNIDR